MLEGSKPLPRHGGMVLMSIKRRRQQDQVRPILTAQSDKLLKDILPVIREIPNWITPHLNPVFTDS
jgi:hypothetical protein